MISYIVYLRINTLITLIMIRYLAFARYFSWVNDHHGIASKVCTSNYFCHLNLLFYALIFFNSRLFSDTLGRKHSKARNTNNTSGITKSIQNYQVLRKTSFEVIFVKMKRKTDKKHYFLASAPCSL